MTVKVNQQICIGCGACAAVAPKSFKLEANGKAAVITPPGDSEKVIREAADGCPVEAIKISK